MNASNSNDNDEEQVKKHLLQAQRIVSKGEFNIAQLLEMLK